MPLRADNETSLVWTLVPVAGLFLELVVVWRCGDRSLALHRFLAAGGFVRQM
jgi:hypothetical protein